MNYKAILEQNKDLTFNQKFIEIIEQNFINARNNHNILVDEVTNSYSISGRFSLTHAFFDLSTELMNSRVLPDFNIESPLIIQSLSYLYTTLKEAYVNYTIMTKKQYVTVLKGNIQIKFNLSTHEYQGTSVKLLLCLKHNETEIFFNIVYDFDEQGKHKFEIQKDLNTYEGIDKISNNLFFILSIPRIGEVINDFSINYTTEEIFKFQKLLEIIHY